MSNILSSARSDTVGATSGERLRAHGMASRLGPGRGCTAGGDAAGGGPGVRLRLAAGRLWLQPMALCPSSATYICDE